MKPWNPNIRVQGEPFDAAHESQRLTAGRSEIGALVTFTGLCRDEGGQLAALELEHFPGMAEKEIARIAGQAMERWPLMGLTIIHRTGTIAPGEPIVLVVTASAHRKAAFEAAEFLMDYLKTKAPFWKKEHYKEGASGGWVDTRSADDKAADRWS